MEWWVKAFHQAVRQAVQSWQPDILQIEFSIMGQYMAGLAECHAPKVLVVHDPGAAGAAARRRTMRGIAKIKQSFDLWAWQRYERYIFRQAQAVVVFTASDQEAVAELDPQAPVVQIPVGIEVPEQPLNPTGTAPENILFIGNYRHPPNVDAAWRVARHIFPALHERHPGLKLYLVGQDPPPELQAAAKAYGDGQQIEVTGLVPDTAPYLDRAAVVVAPIRQGGGMRIKVLEALASGKAVVATPLAAAGLDLEDGKEFLRAESDHDFIEAIHSLLECPEERKQLAQAARRWAYTHLSWENSVRKYEVLYQRLLENRT
jgi:polysaccharide biosynthesis protein PslH